MKTATLPSLRVDPELREVAESVLEEGESLSNFVEASVHEAIDRRRARAEFVKRGWPRVTKPCVPVGTSRPIRFTLNSAGSSPRPVTRSPASFAVRYTTRAREDLLRPYDYLLDRSESAEDLAHADAALEAIERAVGTLAHTPFICRKAGKAPFLR